MGGFKLPTASGGLMRFVTVFVCFAASSVVAGATIPNPDDFQGWNEYCRGFYQEIERQSVEDNNQLAFADASTRERVLQKFSAKMLENGAWGSSISDSWVIQGKEGAGSADWDSGPLLNDKSFDAHAILVASRSRVSKACIQISDMAASTAKSAK